MLFHSGTGKIADGSIPTNNVNISMEGRFRVNHASEQALTLLLAMRFHEQANSSFGFPRQSVSGRAGSCLIGTLKISK